MKLAATNALLQIRRNLELHVGQTIRLRAHRGRRKTLEKIGILENTYPSIFVVRIDEHNYNQRLSFSYADVLTETVELSLMQKDGGVKLLPMAK